MIYGIDVGGTKIEFGIYDSNFKKCDSWRVSTPTDSYSQFLDTLVKLVNAADQTMKTAGKVGLGMPGLIDKNNLSISNNIPCINGKNVQADLQIKLNREVVMENDCRCFALSEAVAGNGEGFSRVYGAIIGTGAAGGLCINGAIDSGKNHVIGEYGHIALPLFLAKRYDLQPHQCGCGLSGCLEYYIAGPGLSRINTHINQDVYSAEELSQKLLTGCEKTKKAFNCYMDILGYAFASIIHHHDPDIIVVGGGVSKIDYVINALPNAIEPYIFKNVELPNIVRAKFGDASGGRGAAILATQL